MENINNFQQNLNYNFMLSCLKINWNNNSNSTAHRVQSHIYSLRKSIFFFTLCTAQHTRALLDGGTIQLNNLICAIEN
jgi:hypothetical protein